MTPKDDAAKHIFEDWHRTIIERDLEGLVALYRPAARFESPAVFALSSKGDGVLRGRDEIRAFFRNFFETMGGDFVDWFRHGTYLASEDTVAWEYPRQTPKGDQAEVLEWIDIEEGLILEHRVYWGWVALRQLLAKTDIGARVKAGSPK